MGISSYNSTPALNTSVPGSPSIQIGKLIGGGPTGHHVLRQAIQQIMADLKTDVDGAILDGDFSTEGLLARTAAATYAARTLTAGAGMTVTNGNGVSGNPTVTAATVITKVARTADATAIQSNTTLANDDTLTLAVAADKIYWFNAIIRYNSGATPDFKYTFTVPTGATLLGGPNDSSAGLAEVDLTTAQTANGSSSDRVLFIRGMLNTAGTAGNLVLQWAQDTSDASDTKILADSCMMLMEM